MKSIKLYESWTIINADKHAKTNIMIYRKRLAVFLMTIQYININNDI